MAVLFGDTRPDGKIRVWRTLHTQNGQPVDATEYPEGYEFEALPEPPAPKAGVDQIMLFDPATSEFTWEEKERPLNPDEVNVKLLEAVERLTTALEATEQKLDVMNTQSLSK